MQNPKGVTVGYICADIAALASCCISLDREDPDNFPSNHNLYTLGEIGPRHVAICGLEEGAIAGLAAEMMNTFTSIKLLILVSSKAGAVPGDSGQVRVGDVVVPTKFVQGQDRDNVKKIDLSQASGLLATAFTSMETAQPWLLDEVTATLMEKNPSWGAKCKRPAGDDMDKLDMIFVRQRKDASLAHHHGVVISDRILPDDATYRDSVAVPLNLGPIACFDNGETAGLPQHRKNVDTVPVLGVSHYCDEDAEKTRRMWGNYASMAAAACAKRIVLGLDNCSDVLGREL
jgi:hypothetical protein